MNTPDGGSFVQGLFVFVNLNDAKKKKKKNETTKRTNYRYMATVAVIQHQLRIRSISKDVSGEEHTSEVSFYVYVCYCHLTVDCSLRTFNSLLNGDPQHDRRIRQNHYYPTAPSINLSKALLDLCGDAFKAGEACLMTCDELSQRLSGNEDHLIVINLIKQLLTYAKLQFIKDPNSNGTVLCDNFLRYFSNRNFLPQFSNWDAVYN